MGDWRRCWPSGCSCEEAWCPNQRVRVARVDRVDKGQSVRVWEIKVERGCIQAGCTKEKYMQRNYYYTV